MGAVEEKSREGTQVGLQRRDSHEGFLWADLGSWCLDKASDFPAWNVRGPRETANHRKGGERRKEEGDRAGRGGQQRKRQKIKTTSTRKKEVRTRKWEKRERKRE